MPKMRKSGRSVSNVIRIFCEGAKTEPQYIKTYIDKLSNSTRRFVVEIEPTKKNTPIQLVDEAVAYRRSRKFVEGDIVWAVYDRESPAKYSDELHSNAFEKALQNDVKIALSSICFEFWLLLHLTNTDAPYAFYDDLAKKSKFRKLYKEASGNDYEKSKANIFDVLFGGIQNARTRAKKINAKALNAAHNTRRKPFHLNPYTNVHELLDDIDALDDSPSIVAD